MINAIDIKILTILQDNARTPNADIARRLEMAPSAIHQRVRKLEERGVIEGYSARVRPDTVGRGLLAFVHLTTDEKLGEFGVAEEIAALPGVLEIHDIAGDDCYLIKVRVADTDALHRLLREEIARIEGVRSTRTTIVLKTVTERSELPLPEPSDRKN